MTKDEIRKQLKLLASNLYAPEIQVQALAALAKMENKYEEPHYHHDHCTGDNDPYCVCATTVKPDGSCCRDVSR